MNRVQHRGILGLVFLHRAGATGAMQEYKTKDAAMLDAVHAGDRVTYSATDTNGTGTLTKLQKQ